MQQQLYGISLCGKPTNQSCSATCAIVAAKIGKLALIRSCASRICSVGGCAQATEPYLAVKQRPAQLVQLCAHKRTTLAGLAQ
jgi:hypothetical protein